MTWIQLLLIISIVTLGLWFVKHQNNYQLRAWSKIFMILFGLVAIYVIILPNSSNTVAHAVGVDRGADLLLYILTISFLFVVLSSYMSRKKDQQHIVSLARKVALLEAKIRNNK